MEGRGTQITGSEKGTSYPDSSQGCHRRLNGPISGVKPIMMSEGESRLWHLLDQWELLPKGRGHIMGCRGPACWECTGLVLGSLGEEPKAEKVVDLDDLGRNTCVRME